MPIAVKLNDQLIYNQFIFFFDRNGYSLNGHDVLPDIQELPPSRPMTPNEQMDIMIAIEEEVLQATGTPSDRDGQVGNSTYIFQLAFSLDRPQFY
jgi:hypothetical protein